MALGKNGIYLTSFIAIFFGLSYTVAVTLKKDGSHVETLLEYEKKSHQSCNWWRGWWGGEECRTIYELVTKERYECEPGWSNQNRESECIYAKCGKDLKNQKTDPGACNIDTGGQVITRNGIIYESGGKCKIGPGQCSECKEGHYWHPPTTEFGGHCALCRQIEHCNFATCTSISSSFCAYCEGEWTNEYGWYAYTQFKDNGVSCQRACSWRAGSRCFPGNCPDTTYNSCRCARGYSGIDCATIDFKPEIITMSMTFKYDTGTSTEIEIVEGPDKYTQWTNLEKFTKVNVTVKANLNKTDTMSIPGYINGAYGNLGIIVKISLNLSLLTGNGTTRTYVPQECKHNEANICHLNEYFDGTNSKWMHAHKDKFYLSVSVTSGGEVHFFNREIRGHSDEEHYKLIGKTATFSLYLGIDLFEPQYCCTQQPFYVEDVTSNSELTVRWDGWKDPDSGIDYYEIQIFHLSIKDQELMMSLKPTNCSACNNIKGQQVDIKFEQEGPYAIFLRVFDRAGNHARARRITMFDPQPVVNFEDGFKTVVITASKETNYTWISKYTSVIEVDWKERFISKKTEQNKWLNAVEKFEGILRDLDDYNGKRTVYQVDNAKGIVKFTVHYKTIYNDTITEYGMTTIPDIHAEKTRLYVQLYDGIRLSIHVRAYDIFDTFLEEVVNVSADFSPPIIQNLWLVKGNRLNISVHNVRELSNLTVEWELYDLHSGIYEVNWMLFDNDTSLGKEIIQHGMSYISPQGEAGCTLAEFMWNYTQYPRGANCYCTPFHGCYHQHFQVKPAVIVSETDHYGLDPNRSKGLHDGDYFFQVEAWNKALHKTVQTMKITIDTSPPHEGIVHEGFQDYPEIDFQDTLEIHAYWSDFFDKESGVMFYRYGFGKSCLTADKFLLDYIGQEQITETYTTQASFTALGEGTYYITVAAYNHALDPSTPVCSDGVTIDTTLPRVKELRIETMRMRPALVKTFTGSNVWYISRDREVYRVENANSTSLEKATLLDDTDLMQYPVKRFPNGTIQSIKPSLAHKAGPMGHIRGTLPAIHNLTISWKTLSGPGGIHDYEVGLSSTNTIFPDHMDFISTNQHSSIHIQSPNILDGVRFYILIKTTSKSSVSNIQTFGPYIVDTTAPTVDGDISVQLRGQYLEASWSRDMFIDEDDSSPLYFQFAIGHQKFSTDVMDYSDVQSGGSCDTTVTPVMCTAIHVNQLHWSLHENRRYYITIKVENTAGLVALVSSESYTHNTLLPTKGVVLDIDTNKKLLEFEDIDFQKSTSEMSGQWYGFYHPHLDLVYNVCVGENADLNTAIHCVDVFNSSSYTFRNLNLHTLKKYFLLVTAVTSAGNVTQFSDGVTVVDEHMYLGFIKVLDGQPCNVSEDIQSIEFTHHSKSTDFRCDDDDDFQSSTNHIAAYWKIPDNITMLISVGWWKLQKKHHLIESWTDLNGYEYLPNLHEVKNSELVLQAGRTFRVAIQLCADNFCYQPIYSDGFTVIPNPPITGSINVSYNDVENKINVVMQKFKDADIMNEKIALAVIWYYEWAFTDGSHIGRTLTTWTRVENINPVNNTHLAFELIVTETIKFSKCWRLSVRGVTYSKLSSAVSTDIKTCDDINNVRPSIVIDAVGDPIASPGGGDISTLGQVIQLEENSNWQAVDRDYTPYTNIISAVWPTLRYKEYKWAVIEETVLDPSVFYNRTNDLDLDNPCSHPHAIQCGTTDKEFMNTFFDDGVLKHGKRYIVCLHADATELVFEKWTVSLPNISSCSDGVTVDLTPPLKSSVWIGPTQDTKYQSYLSDMSISWTSFTDIEEQGFHVHSSGIQRYEVAIGTSPYGVDIYTFGDVGLVNHVTIHNLRLQDGHAYYASIKAYDHVGHSSVSVSPPVKVDTTSPTRTDKKISINGRHIVSTSFVNPCWTGVFYDRESGISKYEWSIGSQQGYEDIMPYTTVFEECGLMSETSNVAMKEGHAYYVSVKAHNGVGLTTMASSWAFIVDASPPVAGHVEDGPLTVQGDIDFQTNATLLSAKWAGFHDPHTTIKEYYVSFGTCPMCDDILVHQPIGITFVISVPNLRLAQGKRHYCTVTACNTADLCSSAWSDGVLIDSTPPIRGMVLDGREGHDITYQSSRRFLGATWFGFWDSQSGLSHFAWRVGTTKGADDILPLTNLHLSDMVSIPDLPDTNLLPVGKKMYVTVRAYNKAGLYAESSSNGFIVDTSCPNFTKTVELVARGLIRPNTLVYRSAMKVQWEVEDQQSFIDRQYVSIQSHLGGDFNLSSTKINGIARDYTFTDLLLHDGSYYDVTVISCNGAGLCSNTTLSKIFVDSSPPQPGMFAISTDHASQPQREPEGWMTWSVFHIKLAWLGFTDIHSGIDTYLVNVGSTYMESDLNKVPGQPMEIRHEPTTMHYGEEGYVQTAKIETSSLNSYREVFVSIWAVNKVGLTSPVIHSLFKLINGGNMELVRRCSSYSCLGHCVCAPHGDKCVDASRQCTNIINENKNSILAVTDVVDFTFPTIRKNPAYTFSETALAAEWKIVKIQGKKPLWYEYSVGYSDYSTPKGVFNEGAENIWLDAGQRMHMVFSLPKGKRLVYRSKYSFFIRAWYNSTTYAVFQSPGLIVRSRPPQPTNILGKAVKEHIIGAVSEVDHVKDTSMLIVDWSDKFLDPPSLEKFQLYISTSPGGHDVHVVDVAFDPNITRYDLSGYKFEPDVTYYTNVLAYNQAGLHTTASSDGFHLDINPPVVGIVFDGSGPGDVEYQNSSTWLAATWHGFEDLESGVMRYEWCVTSMENVTECDILPWKNVHLNTKVERQLMEPLSTGTKLVHKVMAVDVTGQMSTEVTSNGVVIDTTPPIRKQRMDYGENLVANPSFETFDGPTALEDVETHKTCSGKMVPGWSYGQNSCLYIISSNESLASDGRSFVILKGSVFQELVNISIGIKYMVTFYTSNLPFKNADNIHNEGYVKFGDNLHVFLLYNRPQNFQSSTMNNMFSWQKHTFYFFGHWEKTLLEIGSYDGNIGLALDDIHIQAVNLDKDSDTDIYGHVGAHTVFLHDWSSIHAEWNFEDPESPIMDYTWAIGYTEGGTQLQDFKSVGTQSFASNSSLHLIHNSELHITVVATNAAGLKTVSYSDPILIDLTPPAFNFVNDGEGSDVDYQTSTIIKVNWLVFDPESAIQSCQWAVGSGNSGTDIQDFIEVDTSESRGSKDFGSYNLIGLIVYNRIKCKNNAGLTTTHNSDGVRITHSVIPAPAVSIEVIGTSGTEYPVQDSFFGDPTSVRLRWTGFEEGTGISSFLVDMNGPGLHLSEVVLGEVDSNTYATFQGLYLKDGVYTVSVTGINEERTYSEKISTNVTLFTQKPVMISEDLRMTWNKTSEFVNIAWDGLFQSFFHLYYEVTVGFNPSGGDIIQWQETRSTSIAFSLPMKDIGNSGRRVYATVRAIAVNGMYSTLNWNTFLTI